VIIPHVRAVQVTSGGRVVGFQRLQIHFRCSGTLRLAGLAGVDTLRVGAEPDQGRYDESHAITPSQHDQQNGQRSRKPRGVTTTVVRRRMYERMSRPTVTTTYYYAAATRANLPCGKAVCYTTCTATTSGQHFTGDQHQLAHCGAAVVRAIWVREMEQWHFTTDYRYTGSVPKRPRVSLL